MSIKSILIFAAGAIVGGVGTYFAVTKKIIKKYADIANEEIASVKDYYNAKITQDRVSNPEKSQRDIFEQKPPVLENYIKNDISLMKRITTDEGYVAPEPYLIDQDSFGEFEQYQTISMSYYNDGILVEDMTQKPVNVDDTISSNALEHFGDPEFGYDEGVVYVRNEKFKTDYEITKLADNFGG